MSNEAISLSGLLPVNQGGSSAINAIIYIRGNRHDFDHWQALGNPGWSYEDVLPYFKQSEHQQRGASAFHGVSGPLSVTDPIAPSAINAQFIEAAAELGYDRNADFNFQAIQEPDAFLYLFRHRFNFIYAEHPDPGDRPKWKTEDRHPLSDRLLQEGASLCGVRFGKQTDYLMLDIDPGSLYHPNSDRLAISRLLTALERLGLVEAVA